MYKSIFELCFCTMVFAVKAQKTNIKQVEINLKETRTIEFENSIYPTFIIQQRMKHYNIPSVSIAVINNGKIEWRKAYGFADIENNGQ